MREFFKFNFALHPDWRLLVSVSLFGAACAYATLRWQQNTSVAFLIGFAFFAFVLTGYNYHLNNKLKYSVYVLVLVLAGLLMGHHRIQAVSTGYKVPWKISTLQGHIERIEYRPEGRPSRLYVTPTKIGKLTSGLPTRVRVTTRTTIEEGIAVGSHVEFAGKFEKPNGPIVPGGYDFSRSAFFGEIGANVIAVTPIRILKGSDVGIRHYISQLREHIERLILANIPGQQGAVAIALVVGFRNHLSTDTIDALRAAGLSHLLAISGLHMGLVTVTSFFLFELLFAAMPFVALRIMPKKLAILPTWCIAIFYLLISGASTSTIRAFIMVSVGLLAVFMDRRVVSLRSVALAAALILIIWPEMILSVGFQMSFAATAGLVVFYEGLSKWLRSRGIVLGKSSTSRVVLYVLGMGLTSIIAQISIAPFALYHFQALSIVGVISNTLVLPIMSLFVMPLLLLSLFLMPLGGFSLFVLPIEYCIEIILYIAHWVAAFPYAVLRTGVLSDMAFGITVVLFMVILVVRHRVVAGLSVLSAAALLLFGQINTADVLVSPSGKIIAEKQSGDFIVTGGRRSSFRERAWRTYWAIAPEQDAKKHVKICDGVACSYQLVGLEGRWLTYISALEAVKSSCARGDIVILPKRYARYCKGYSQLITQEELKQRGPLGFWFEEGGGVQIKWSSQ